MRGAIKQSKPPGHTPEQVLEAIEQMLDEVAPVDYFEANTLVPQVLRQLGWRMGNSFGSGAGEGRLAFHAEIIHTGAPRTLVETTWTPRPKVTPAPTFGDEGDVDHPPHDPRSRAWVG